MPARRPAPSLEEIRRAFAAAEAGKGWRLARLVKSFSVEDLASAFGHRSGRLRDALAFASGMREMRQEMSQRAANDRRAERRRLKAATS